jgi:protein-disulfide isomerase
MKDIKLPLLLAVLPLALAGCASTTPNYDQEFGTAVRAAIAQQTINPEASRNTDPVLGLDGKATAATMKNYDKSFVTPEKSDISDDSFGSTD